MDPPLQTSEDLLEPPPRVETLPPHAPFASTLTAKSASVPPLMAAEGRCSEELGSTVPNNQQRLDPSADDMIGQFSFAPATQTTVITTTTTTTTSFPPLMIKAPHHLHELDSKLYPLATSPTPKCIKRLCFDVGGRPTVFAEADDTRGTWEEVR